MLFKFTAAGDTLFRSNPSTFTIDKVVLGSSFGYTLADPPTDIQGSEVYTSIAVLSRTVIGPNTIRFVKLLDRTVGDFDFGEVACYSGSTIVAVGVNPTPIEKTSDDVEEGNSIGLNIFLSNSNEDAYGFLQLTNSTSNLAVSQINQVDYLNPPYDGEPNIYVINGLTPDDIPCLAFSDSYGRWNFSSKPEIYYEGTVFGTATFTAIDIETPHAVDFLSASQHYLQFISGELRGHVRQLTSIGSDFFSWNTPFTSLPQEGDEFIIVGPQASSGGGGGDFQTKIQFKDEGVDRGGFGTVSSVNFTGGGVDVTEGFYNDITISIPGSAATSGIFQAIFFANTPSNFAGNAFSDWNVSSISEASFCELSGTSIVFNTGGVFKITIEGRAIPSSDWPEGNKTFGTIMSNTEYSTHSRYATTGQTFVGTIAADINTSIARFSDTYVLDFGEGQTYTPIMYGSSYQNQSDPVTFRCKVSIELLKVVV